MKKIVLPWLAFIMCLVSDTAVCAITATTSSPVVALPPGNTDHVASGIVNADHSIM
jgi:hypothetical protein